MNKLNYLGKLDIYDIKYKTTTKNYIGILTSALTDKVLEVDTLILPTKKMLGKLKTNYFFSHLLKN